MRLALRSLGLLGLLLSAATIAGCGVWPDTNAVPCEPPSTLNPATEPRATPAPGTPAPRLTYVFALQHIPDGVLQPGVTAVVTWLPVECSSATTRDASAPPAVEASIALYGPYSSHDAAAQALADAPGVPKKQPTEKPVVTNTPFGLSAWEAGAETESLTIPASVQPGYYFVLAQTSRPMDGAWCISYFVVRVGNERSA